MRTINAIPVQRDRLFFDQYQYSICFRVPEAGALRAKDSQEVLKNINWRNESRRRYHFGNNMISDKNIEILLDMWSRLAVHLDKIKFSISFDRVYLYGNDLGLLKSLAVQDYTTVYYAQEALITKPKDVVVKRNSKFKMRSYFKERSIEQHEQDLLRNFLFSRQESYGISNSFKGHLLKTKWFYLMRHNYIDHNSLADLTMLSLVMPGLIRKTVPIQAK